MSERWPNPAKRCPIPTSSDSPAPGPMADCARRSARYSFARRTSRRRAQGTTLADSTRPTLLSVDDEQSILDLIRIEFEDDFDVVTATSGTEALDLLAHRHVDVILLDLRMPDMDGEEGLRRISSAQWRPPGVWVSRVDQDAASV